MEPSPENASAVAKRLMSFYGQPEWRNPLPAIDELVSTILSQNTNDQNRDKAFFSLVEKFETWEAARVAPEKDVIECIRPAGLANQKGPRIQHVLNRILEERGNLDLQFLKTLSVNDARNWLTRFNGVGPKTAAIVLCFALDMPAFPVDTHIYRVTGRLGLRPEKLSVEDAHPLLESLFSPEYYFPVHLNIIRLGREICQARKPRCPVCPLRELCNFANTK